MQGIRDYLAEHPAATVLHQGRVLFDLRTAQYQVEAAHGRCLLQIWSDQQNLVRTVIALERRASCLRLATRQMGSAKPEPLEILPTGDRPSPSARDSSRRNYLRLLERVLRREFLDAKIDGMRSAMDLEHSFGPAYARGRVLRGVAAEAVIGVGQAESATTIDGILTLGILWLDHCRSSSNSARHFTGLKLIVPAGAWRTTAERMAWLNHAAADFQLYALDERTEELTCVDFRDTGNLEFRLTHAYSREAAVERCQDGLDRLFALIPPDHRQRVEVHPRSAAEVGLLLHGLEFARVRNGVAAHSFSRENEITFGAGPHETALDDSTQDLCRELFASLFAARSPHGSSTDPVYRLQPERWLESQLRAGIADVAPGLRPELMLSQVPALAAGDRGMLDLLTLDRDGRLHVIEVKADEDLHLPLQALDYWIRVRALNDDRRCPPSAPRPSSAFERQGYFASAEVSLLPPRLLLVAPALRIHPGNQIVLRYLSPQIDWELIAVGEHWRRELQVVFRKRTPTPLLS